MPEEYWLQKKTLGGWSQVTWYDSLEQANENYLKCVGKGGSGYSWRLVKVELVSQSLNNPTEIKTPELDSVEDNHTIEMADNKALSGWSNDGVNKSGWGDIPSDSSKSKHDLSGSVWVINHLTRQKLRVPASELQKHLDNGFERGGPRTQFRENYNV